MTMLSIDQNCHSLWDTLPKLCALSAKGYSILHLIEDIDVAFTAIGAGEDSNAMRITPERYYRSGGADWGAAMFYSNFLGRQPVEIRDWEPFTGLKTKTLAHQLERSVDDLYDEFSPSDNFQLIGPSYISDKDHHRTVGDLTVAECRPYLHEIFAHARDDVLLRFPSSASQQRTRKWFADEGRLMQDLLAKHSDSPLVELYRGWMQAHLPAGVTLGLTSEAFSTNQPAGRREVLDLFLKDYETAADLYNEAIATTGVRLRRLRTDEGELPFFATCRHEGHLVRTAMRLQDNQIIIAGNTFRAAANGSMPTDEMSEAGILAIAGKAIVLVAQACAAGGTLALPYRGSVYMPAALAFRDALISHRMLSAAPGPITRVRLGLLDSLVDIDTPVRLPEYLQAAFGYDVLPASEISRNYAPLRSEAQHRLDLFRTPEGRTTWQQVNDTETLDEIETLDHNRRNIAKTDPKNPAIREIWKEIKTRQRSLLASLTRQVAADYQMIDIDFWDTRGAIWPWAVALGGEEFYQRLISNAQVYREPEEA